MSVLSLSVCRLPAGANLRAAGGSAAGPHWGRGNGVNEDDADGRHIGDGGTPTPPTGPDQMKAGGGTWQGALEQGHGPSRFGGGRWALGQRP